MKSLITIGLLAALASSVHASTVLVSGGDFEDAPIAAGTGYNFAYSSYSTSEFSLSNPSGDGVGAINTDPGSGNGDTTKYAFLNQKAGDSASTLTELYASAPVIVSGDSYTSSVDIGNPQLSQAVFAGTITLNLYAETASAAFTLLNTTTVYAGSITNGTFKTFNLSLTSAQTAGFGGDHLIFEAVANANAGAAAGTATQTYFDNVSISDPALTVPEPSTYALIGCGLVGLFAVRRFRNLSKI